MENLMIDQIKEQFSTHVKKLQNQITEELIRLDSALEQTEDVWSRKDFTGNPGGGGITRVFAGNQLIENAGVNTSLIHGAIDPQFAGKLQGSGSELWATGISLIIHPRNPRVPTVHANFRMIHQGDRVWFGGGADLTPYYPYEDDFHYFHSVWNRACGPLGKYDEWKKWCDEYFTNHHRGNEMRGVGGIFFDTYSTGDIEKDFTDIKNISEHFIESYFPIVEKRMNEKWTAEDEDFQLHRRGRYVEFNLVHDRGTLFGLKTNGRTDSILVSLPARCKYSYRYMPPAGSPHEKMWKYYEQGHDWLQMN